MAQGDREPSRTDRRRPCPRCSTGELERVRTSKWVRIFRVMPGLHPRSYQCGACDASIRRWREG